MSMKKYLHLALVLGASSVFAACSSDEMENTTICVHPGADVKFSQSLFPEEGSAKLVPSNGAQALNLFLQSKDFKMENALRLTKNHITEDEWNEIKDYVDKNLRGDTELATYQKIFKWCVDSLHYTYDDNALEPYEVFKKRRCVCQGYANLCKTMLLTQGIPAFGANGMFSTQGAHAWLYAYVDKKWRVSDPTNNHWYNMSDLSKYKDQLIIRESEIELFEDDNFGYNYSQNYLNVCRVKKCDGEALTVPFSVAGYKISMFNPTGKLPENVRQIYFGSNIRSLGEQGEPLFGKDQNVEEAYVASTNMYLSSENGVVYRGKGTNIYYIPGGIHRLVLRPKQVIEKNTVYDKSEVEEIVLGEGTETVEDYAFESLPKLKRVYVPESVKNFSENALYRCPADVEIIRTSTGIHPVEM